MTSTDALARPLSANWQWKLALAAFLTIYFLCFNWGTLRVHFALDDLGNMGHYYEYSPGQLVLSNFLPWRGDSRPLGGLFYIPIFHFAGLNPIPYQAVLLLILLATVYWIYRFVRLLGAGELASALAALVYCYHGGLGNLYYNAAFVFDALCCFFYFAAFVYYLRIRTRGQLPGAWQSVVFLGLFLCALNSKEMAVSIPVMLMAYEWFYHPPARWNVTALLGWLRGPARLSLIAAVLNLVDIYGKVAGPTPMTNFDSYRPVFTLDRVREFQVGAAQDLFFSWTLNPGWGTILAFWALLAYLAFRRDDRPVLRFLFCFLLVAPLPIEFLPGKRQACLALLMVGLGAFASIVFVDAVGGAAGLVTRLFRLPAAGYKLLVGIAVIAAVSLWAREQYELRLQVGRDPMTTLGFETWDIIQQMRASPFHPHHGSRLAFLEEPFHNVDIYYLSRLWIHDPSVTLHIPSQGPMSATELASMDYLFSIEKRKLVRSR